MIYISDANTYLSSSEDLRRIEHMYPPEDFMLGILLNSLRPADSRSGKGRRKSMPGYDLSVQREVSGAGITHVLSPNIGNPGWERSVSRNRSAVGYRINARDAHADMEGVRRLFRLAKEKLIVVAPDIKSHVLVEECLKAHIGTLQNGNTLLLAHFGGFSSLPLIKAAKRTLVDISGFHSPHILSHALRSYSGRIRGLAAVAGVLNRDAARVATIMGRGLRLGHSSDPDAALSNLLRDHLPVFRSAFSGLVDYLGEDKLVFGSGLPMFWPEHTLLLLTGLKPSSRGRILHRNISDALKSNANYRRQYKKSAQKPQIMFLPPYTSNSSKCTAALCIRSGQASQRKGVDGFRGVLMAPSASTCLSRLDSDLVSKEGLMFVDGPWELLHTTADKVIRNGGQIRRLPHSLEPGNKYYCKENPVYYKSSYKFSTSEAVAYSLAILGRMDEGRNIGVSQGFADKFDANIGLA